MITSYPWYFRDWRASNQRALMTLEERGLYREILDLCYQEGSLPNDEDEIRMLASSSEKEFKRSWPKVRATLFDTGKGRLTHPRVAEILPDLVRLRESRQKSAMNAVRKRWERKKPSLLGTPRNTSGNTLPTLHVGQNPTTDIDTENIPPSPLVDCVNFPLFETFRREYPEEVTDWVTQVYVSVVTDEALLLENLAAWKETRKWREGYHPSAENFLRKGIWKTAPPPEPSAIEDETAKLPSAAEVLAKVKAGLA